MLLLESFIREFLEEESPEFIEDVITKRALLLPQEIVTMIMAESRKADEPVQDVRMMKIVRKIFKINKKPKEKKE